MDIKSLAENSKVKGIFLGVGSVQNKKGQFFDTIAIENDVQIEEFWLTPAIKRELTKSKITEGDKIVLIRSADQEIEPCEATRIAMDLQKGETVPASQIRILRILKG